MRRVAGVPLAVAALVWLPGVVAGTTGATERSDGTGGGGAATAAAKSKLALKLTGDEGNEPFRFSVRGSGPPPDRRATLRDPTGLQRAVVASSDGCDGPVRGGYDEPDGRWCLVLRQVPAGHELTGVVRSGGDGASRSMLELTVTRRDAFLPLPLAAILVGLLIGVAAVFVKPALGKRIGSVALGQLVRKNRTDDARRIHGLGRFVRDRMMAGESVEGVKTKVYELVTSGPERAREQRRELKAKEDTTEMCEGHPLRKAARAEARRTDHRIEDFYGDDGKRTAHPAVDLGRALVLTDEHRANLEDLSARLKKTESEDLPTTESQQDAATAIGKAEQAHATASTLDAVERVATLVGEAEDAVATVEAEQRRRGYAADQANQAAALPRLRWVRLPPTAVELGGADYKRSMRWAVTATATALVALFGFAIATVALAVYGPNETFHSLSDYFALFSAGVGSGVVASAAAILRYWQPNSATESG